MYGNPESKKSRMMPILKFHSNSNKRVAVAAVEKYSMIIWTVHQHGLELRSRSLTSSVFKNSHMFVIWPLALPSYGVELYGQLGRYLTLYFSPDGYFHKTFKVLMAAAHKVSLVVHTCSRRKAIENFRNIAEEWIPFARN